MDRLEEYFYIKFSNDHMSAQIYCKDSYEKYDVKLSVESLQQFLFDNKVFNGIDQQVVQLLLTNPSAEMFPYIIAEGTPVEHGKNGKVKYELNFNTEIDRTPDWNFRDIMSIPSVEMGQKLATLLIPTNGQEGIDVGGRKIKAIKGKPIVKKAGNNVVYREMDRSFYAVTEGQLSVNGRYIHVQPVFEVNETLSMKNGNLDFIGSIVIHGDVPAGYTVKADGDIKIHGMVEAATLIAGGTIYISEGLAGQKKGFIEAKENINIGYINQGIVYSGNNLYVENSILHSECTVKSQLFCQQGNIIGGYVSAGRSIEAKDIGNRLGTKTEILFGLDKSIDEQEEHLLAKKRELQQTAIKLATLGKKLEVQGNIHDAKLRITMLRQQHSSNKAKAQLEEIDDKLQLLNAHLGSELEAKLVVRNFIYSNVSVSFGKYKRIMKSDCHFVQLSLNKNEIIMHPLFE